MFRIRERHFLADNWYLRQSPSLSQTGSQLLSPATLDISAPPKPLSPVGVTMPAVTRAEPVTPTSLVTRAQVEQGEPVTRSNVGYDRQISRVRSISVFSTESHIRRDEESHDDDLSIDFDILEQDEVLLTSLFTIIIFISKHLGENQ